jgi:hypothetical protein
MDMSFNHALIFLPMLVVIALTIIGFARMAHVRVKTIRSRQVPLRYYVAFQNGVEPESTAVAVRHYANLFEAPIIFYVACITAFALEAGSEPLYFTAWAYAVARVAQSAIHLSYNNVQHRAMVFLAGWVALAALWIQIAMVLAARIS